MSHRKNQNSILFLTTLGVYLGLLLVGGAAPQAFAHSATTRAFEITDEIEVKDDLDKNPDDRAMTSLSLQVYLEDIELFLNELRRYRDKNSFDDAVDTFEVAQRTQLPCVAANRTGSYTADSFITSNERVRKPLEFFSKLLTDGYSLGDCLADTHFSPQEATDSKFTFKLDKNEFNVEVVVRKRSADRALTLSTELADLLASDSCISDSGIRKTICGSTSFRLSDDQVFVVTRLPRAGLDSLLAKDAK
jgi:hypothetical protein